MKVCAFRCQTRTARPWLAVVVAGGMIGLAAGKLHWRQGGFWIAVYLLGVAFAVQVWFGRWHSLAAAGVPEDE